MSKQSDYFYDLVGKMIPFFKNLAWRKAQGFPVEDLINFSLDWKDDLSHAFKVPFPVATVQNFQSIVALWASSQHLAIKFFDDNKFPQVVLCNEVSYPKLLIPEYSTEILRCCYAPLIYYDNPFVLYKIAITDFDAPNCEREEWQWARLSSEAYYSKRYGSLDALWKECLKSRCHTSEVETFLAKALEREIDCEQDWVVITEQLVGMPYVIEADGICWKIFPTKRGVNTTIYAQRTII